jgi:molybdopterin molybdotransferase
MHDYDPEALPVETARRVIRSLVTPVTASERVAVRASLGRVLGADVVSTLNVPAHDNSAMDGFAVCGADLKKDGDTVLHEIGTAFAGRVFGAAVGPGKCVRVMTGAVMPVGTDTVVIQEVVRSRATASSCRPAEDSGRTAASPAKTSRSGASRSPRGDSCVRRSSGSSPRSAWPR